MFNFLMEMSKESGGKSRKEKIKELKILWAANHFINVSDLVCDIAKAVDVSEKKLEKWIDSDLWIEALKFWGIEGIALYVRPVSTDEEREQQVGMMCDLRKAAYLWRKGEHEKSVYEDRRLNEFNLTW